MAVFGLYGAATSKWEMSAKVEESGAFDAFWDSIAFIANAVVFFYSGVACVNFFVRYDIVFTIYHNPPNETCDARQMPPFFKAFSCSRCSLIMQELHR